MHEKTSILILGAGSIGERHIRNLWQLGYRNIGVFRQRNLPFRDIATAEVTVFTSFEESLQHQPQVAFICTPTSQHLQQVIMCMEHGMHVFCEKPLSHSTIGFSDLEQVIRQRKKFLQVAYMMRFHPLLLKVHNIISTKVYGRLHSIETYWGSYLPGWHPWEDYKQSYAAKESLGGGVALTLSHDIDLALWLSGSDIESLTSSTEISSSLAIETESVADFEFRMQNGVKANVHLNYLDEPSKRYYQFTFEQAVLFIDYFQNAMTLTTQDGTSHREVLNGFERNDLYLSEITSWFELLSSHTDPVEWSLNQIRESERIIRVCSYAKPGI